MENVNICDDVEKKYSMTLKGNVQNQGFRSIVKDSGNEHHLNGEVFNRLDKTVIIYCGGDNDDISDFIRDIEIEGKKVSIAFDIIEKVELPSGFRLPQGFFILDTDTPADQKRKLDTGLEDLRGIRIDISDIDVNISSIAKNTSVIPELVDGQNKLVDGQNKLVEILERIEKKL